MEKLLDLKKKSLIPGAGRTRVWHHYGSDELSSPYVLKSAKGPNILGEFMFPHETQINKFSRINFNLISMYLQFCSQTNCKSIMFKARTPYMSLISDKLHQFVRLVGYNSVYS